MHTGVSYFARTRLKHMEEDMEAIRQNNCDYVIHTFSESDLEFYKGTVEKLIKISHDKGLEVWLDPWGVGAVFGGESYSQFISRRLDTRQISSRGESLPAACFNNEKFRKFIKGWLDAAIEIGADCIFWDEPHFYIFEENIEEKIDSNPWACSCDACRKAFESVYNYKFPLQMNKDLQEFKEDSIVKFLEEMSDYAGTRGVKNSFCFLPFDSPVGGVRDWEKFAAIKALDIVGTDPYWPTNRDVDAAQVKDRTRLFSKRIKALCDKYNKEAQIWILNFRIKDGTEGFIKIAVEAAYQEGIRNFAAWSYYGTEMMASLSSDNPVIVWKTLGEAYHNLKQAVKLSHE